MSNENIKRPGFYKLHITRVFSNFSQLKQLNEIKNTISLFHLLQKIRFLSVSYDYLISSGVVPKAVS